MQVRQAYRLMTFLKLRVSPLIVEASSISHASIPTTVTPEDDGPGPSSNRALEVPKTRQDPAKVISGPTFTKAPASGKADAKLIRTWGLEMEDWCRKSLSKLVCASVNLYCDAYLSVG